VQPTANIQVVEHIQQGSTYSRMLSGPQERFEFNMHELIPTELEISITFASLALDSRTEETRQRSRRNARKVYDTLSALLEQVPVWRADGPT